nr:hypothetical protein Iba_chr09aCG5260 [Ipomoea batatas]
MLVTRKKTQTDAYKGHRHPKKSDQPPTNRGNKFQALATEVDVDDRSTAPARKTSQQNHPNPKGKSSNHPNQPRQSAAPRSEYARRAVAGNSSNPNSDVRGSGRFNGRNRGKEKAMNNRGIAPQRERHVTNGGTGNGDNAGNGGVFQFGSQALAPNLQTQMILRIGQWFTSNYDRVLLAERLSKMQPDKNSKTFYWTFLAACLEGLLRDGRFDSLASFSEAGLFSPLSDDVQADAELFSWIESQLLC